MDDQTVRCRFESDAKVAVGDQSQDTGELRWCELFDSRDAQPGRTADRRGANSCHEISHGQAFGTFNRELEERP